jgi:hypothetical protein
MLICVSLILLDNLLQCLLFITMIDLSKTCVTAASLICYALVMVMIYRWIKIKLKVLMFPTHVPPMRGMKRFGIKDKLAPRYIDLFLILEKLGVMAVTSQDFKSFIVS